MSSDVGERSCWCGSNLLFEYSADYHVCRACGTLVSRAARASKSPSPKNSSQLYTEDYWLRRQREHHGLPDIHARSRLDLPERCTHWLQHLLTVQLPPARVLELGCGHGGYVALLNWAGFSAIGTEMSSWVADFAKKTFAVEVLPGPIEAQNFSANSFDVIILNDVLEHLENPAETLARCTRLLSAQGFFVIQTPEYKEHLTFSDLQATNDLFLRHMENNNEEHLYLFSRRGVTDFFSRLGFSTLAFSEPVYGYDMFFTASRRALTHHHGQTIWESLSSRPAGRLVQALLDKAYESNDRGWAIKRLEQNARPKPE